MLLKVRLLLGVAAPFMLALPAAAQVSISTATTSPISTSTANNGAPSDVTITTTGTITAPAGVAGSNIITVDSNNTVTNNGAISINNADNSVGVRFTSGGRGGSYTGTGAISVLEDYAPTDTDGDGDPDGPLAQGTGRTGLLVEDGAAMTGNISFLTGSVVTVEGNNSQGVSIRSALTGNYDQAGSINVTGSNSVGLEFLKNVDGNIHVGGGLQAMGENSVGINVLGNVSGEFMIDGTITATGFTSTTISNYADPDLLTSTDVPIADRRDPDDLLVGGPAVAVRGNLVRGFLVNGAAVGDTVDPTTDVKDVVQNFNENRTAAIITSVGSAPAVLIQPLSGAGHADIRLSKVRESVHDTLDDDKDGDTNEIIGVFDYDFGFINRGQIVGNGLNIGFAATGLRFAGSDDGAYKTIIDGGIFNGGQITAQGFEANAVAVSIGSGTQTPQLKNIGAIVASVNTETDHDSYAVRLDAGASVPIVNNSGNIAATTRGYGGDAVAFQDNSGSVLSFTNSSRITASHIDDDTTDDITSGTGRNIALDLSHAASGVTLTQLDTVDNARLTGDVLLGAGNDRFDLLSGIVTGNVDFGAGSDTFNINSASLVGNVNFSGTGAALSMSNGGILTGDVTLGAAGGALSFTGGSVLNGSISRTSNAAALTLALNNSEVNNHAAGTLQLNSMSLQNNSKLGFVVNNARIAGNTPIFNITGTADIAANTVFTPIFEQFSNQPFTLRVLTASTLNLGGPIEKMLNTSSPYLYNVSLARPAGTNAIDLSFRVKTAAELGLSTRETSAYNGVLNMLANSDTVSAAITSISNGPEFLRAYSDILPAPDGSIVQVLASNATAAFGATAHRLDLITEKPDAPGGAWVEEFGVYHEDQADSDGLGIFGGGFGVAGGLDLIASRNWVLGGYVAMEQMELEERGRTSAPLNVAQTTFGAYGGYKLGNLALNGATSIGRANFTSDREIKVASLTDRIRGDWNATTITGGARATYTVPLGFLKAVPYAAVDYVSVDQDAYSETGATNAALALSVGKSKGSLSSASYGISLAGEWGSPGGSFVARPEISVGYRNVLKWDSPDGVVRFGGSSPTGGFTLATGHDPKDAVVAGLGLNINGQYVNMKVGYDAEISDKQITHYGSITLRLAFW